MFNALRALKRTFCREDGVLFAQSWRGEFLLIGFMMMSCLPGELVDPEIEWNE